jgi:hypothetical protein
MEFTPKKIVNFNAKLLSDSNTTSGIVENLSKDSLYLKLFEVKIQPDSVKAICLSCRVMWSYKTPPHGLTNSMGMEIIRPPQSYKEFYNNLSV